MRTVKKLVLSNPTYVFIFFLCIQIQILSSQVLLDPLSQQKFVNPLPIPAQIDITAGGEYSMEMNQTMQWLGLVDPTTNIPLLTTVWGYGPENGVVSYPGPTFIAKRDIPVNITWHNKIPGPHIIPVDYSLHMAHPMGVDVKAFYDAGNVPTVVHLHGGHTESASDGLPEAWFTQGFAKTGNFFVKQKYTYHNDQEAATLWYHDHALGITRLNVYAGLAGFYLLEDKNERDLVKSNVLPKGKHDVELVFQDRMFTADGQFFLPSKTGDPWFGDIDGEPLELPYNPSVVAEFFGDFILVNGATWPFLSVEPRPYRFRLLNGSDSRVYVFEVGSPGNSIPFLQIASDNALLPNAVEMNRLVLAPGERAEVVIDFAAYENHNLVMYNYGPDGPYKGVAAAQQAANPQTTGQVMQFQVNQKLKANKGIPIPTVTNNTVLNSPMPNLENLAVRTRKLALFEGEDSDGRLQPLLGIVNGDEAKTNLKLNGSLAWFEDITETPGLGDVEEWWVYNNTEDAHPIHLHLVSFKILDRQPFTAMVYEQQQIQHNGAEGIGGYMAESTLVHTGPAELPPVNERGWKDTFIVPPGYVGRVAARFDQPGRYVWHCHILSHEDHEMMRPFMVINTGLKSASFAQTEVDNDQFKDSFRVYPNPASGSVNLMINLEEELNVQANVYSMDGRLLYGANFGLLFEGYNTRSLNLTFLNKGLYILEVVYGEKIYKEQLVIQ